MNSTDLHKVNNLLLRLQSIVDCIEVQGPDFVTLEVQGDIEEAINSLRIEFSHRPQGEINELNS